MPANTRQLEQDLQEEDAKTAQAQAGSVAQRIPPAQEPLSAKNLELLGSAVAQAVPILSGGQVEELELPQMPDGADAVPPELGVPLLTIAAFIGKAGEHIPGIEAYAFDPNEAMASNAGLVDAAHQISGLMDDKKIIGALSSGGAGAAPPPDEAPDLEE